MTKLCGLCGLIKTIDQWAVCKGTKDGLQSKCKDCQREYRITNKTKHRDYAAAYRSKHRLEAVLYAKEWRDNNPSYRPSPEKDAAKTAKRRASKLKATPSWVDNVHLQRIDSIYKACKGVTQRSGTPHHVDHIVPLRGVDVCGLHVWWNLRIVPASLNLQKGNKHEEY